MTSIENQLSIKKWMTFLCSDPIVGMVIGKSGVNVKNISRESQCRIDFDGIQGGVRQMRLFGTSKGIAHACFLISKMISERNTPVKDIDQVVEPPPVLLLLIVHNMVSGGLIGKQGENIKNIRKVSGAKLKIINNEEGEFDTLFVEGDPLYNLGNPQEIHKAMEMVATIYINISCDVAEWVIPKESEPPLLDSVSNIVYHSFEIPSELSTRIIGRSGNTIRRLKQHSSAQLFVETGQYPHRSTVRISGNPSCVALCQKMITLEIGALIHGNRQNNDRQPRRYQRRYRGDYVKQQRRQQSNGNTSPNIAIQQ